MNAKLRKMAMLLSVGFGAIICVASAQRAVTEQELAQHDATGATLARHSSSLSDHDRRIARNADRLFAEGRRIFREETFGDEVFWGDTLQLHRAIAGERFGDVGPGVSPKQALALGLKVDVEALPGSVVAALRAGRVDLDDPAVTLTLLKANAVVGLNGRFAPDLSVFVSLLGVDEATVKKVLLAWGPGKFDAQLNLDGKGFRPDGKTAATLIPPAYGMAGVNLHTWTGGWGGVPYWNAFVANLELQGQGTFWDPRLNDASQYPVAARAGFGNKRSEQDLVTSKLAALQFYQLAIPAPTPPAGSFDRAGAARGGDQFKDKARCATCHVPPLFTEPGWNTHKAEEIGIDDFQASRSPDKSYRTPPLKGLWAHSKGGFYLDGRFARLIDVVNHYDDFLQLGLTTQEKQDLVEYLKSL